MSFRFLTLILLFIGQKLIADEPKFSIFADALYWYTTETIDWAISLSENPSQQTIKYQTISFDWNPGFRAGVGYRMAHDEWDTQFYYTWFQAQMADRVSSHFDGIASAFLGNKIALFGAYRSAKVELKLRFNMFDWELGRQFVVSQFLHLRPFIGLKGGWINQSIHSKWQKEMEILHAILAVENLKNNFAGGGPQLGVNGKWILANDFSLITDVAAAFMWGHFSIKDHFHNNLNTMVRTRVGTRNFGALVLRAFMGIGWDVHSHFSAKLGYEIQDWFSQYQIMDNGTGTHNNDLILQGLTLDLRFHF